MVSVSGWVQLEWSMDTIMIGVYLMCYGVKRWVEPAMLHAFAKELVDADAAEPLMCSPRS
jgi:hypothetical protein